MAKRNIFRHHFNEQTYFIRYWGHYCCWQSRILELDCQQSSPQSSLVRIFVSSQPFIVRVAALSSWKASIPSIEYSLYAAMTDLIVVCSCAHSGYFVKLWTAHMQILCSSALRAWAFLVCTNAPRLCLLWWVTCDPFALEVIQPSAKSFGKGCTYSFYRDKAFNTMLTHKQLCMHVSCHSRQTERWCDMSVTAMQSPGFSLSKKETGVDIRSLQNLPSWFWSDIVNEIP